MSLIKTTVRSFALIALAGIASSAVARADAICASIQDCETLRSSLQSQLILVNAKLETLKDQPASRVSSTGAVFTRITGNAVLGEAWQDPSGVIWGDVVTDLEGNTKYLTVGPAADFCASNGARLATYQDLKNLKAYLGYGTRAGYKPQILPNLVNSWFLGERVRPGADSAFTFYGGGGGINSVYGSTPAAFRCVVSQ